METTEPTAHIGRHAGLATPLLHSSRPTRAIRFNRQKCCSAFLHHPPAFLSLTRVFRTRC